MIVDTIATEKTANSRQDQHQALALWQLLATWKVLWGDRRPCGILLFNDILKSFVAENSFSHDDGTPLKRALQHPVVIVLQVVGFKTI